MSQGEGKSTALEKKTWKKKRRGYLDAVAQLLKLECSGKLKDATLDEILARLLTLPETAWTQSQQKVDRCNCSGGQCTQDCPFLYDFVSAAIETTQVTTSVASRTRSKTVIIQPIDAPPCDECAVEVEFRNAILSRATWEQLPVVNLKKVRKMLVGTNGCGTKAELAAEICGYCENHWSCASDSIRGVAIRTLWPDGERASLDWSKLQQLPTLLLSRDHERVDINEKYSEYLRSELNPVNLTARRFEVMTKHGRDLYTQLTMDDLDGPEVDHIIERQFIAQAIASSGLDRGKYLRPNFRAPIHNLTNSLENLNVTSSAVNVQKGQCFRVFLSEEAHSGNPRPLHVVMTSDIKGRERGVHQFAGNILSTMSVACPWIESEIRSCRRGDGFVSSSADYEQLADRVQSMYELTGCEEFLSSGVSTRGASAQRK